MKSNPRTGYLSHTYTSNLPRHVLIVLFILIAAMPVRLWFSLGLFQTLTILDIALWLLAAGLLLLSQFKSIYVGPRHLFVAICIPLGIAVTSFFWSEDHLATTKMVVYSATAIFGYWVPVNLFRRCSSWFIAGCMGLFVVLSVSLALLYWFQVPFLWTITDTDTRQWFDWGDPYKVTAAFARLNSPYLGKSNDFATTLALYVLFFAGVARATSHKRYGVLAFIAALGVLLTLSRGVMIGMTGTLFITLFVRPKLRRIVSMTIAAGLLIIPLYFFVRQVEETGIDILGARQDSRGIYSRSESFSVAFDMVEQSPLLGYGGGRYLTKYVEDVDSAFHNTYLEQWAAYGMAFGSLVILALLSLPWFFLRWTKSPGPVTIVAQHTGFAAIAFLLICTSETSNEAAIPSLMFRFFVGCAVAYLKALQSEQTQRQKGIPSL